MKNKTLLIATITLIIFACKTKSTAVTDTKTTTKEEPKPIIANNLVGLSPELAKGKALYETNCAKCHKLYEPKDFSAQKWVPIMYDMQKKAKIDDATADQILAYLQH